VNIQQCKKALVSLLPGLLLALSLFWFIYRFYWTLGYTVGVMNDEAEHLVIAMMLKAGGHLYGDIFSQHGPFAYLISQVIYFLTNSLDFRNYRIVVGLLYLLSALAIIFSPVFRCGWQRFVSAAIFLALAASYAPSWHGHMFIYYNLAGCLFLIAFVQVLLPVWFSIKVGKVPLFLGAYASP
jgi:hypothetical protein